MSSILDRLLSTVRDREENPRVQNNKRNERNYKQIGDTHCRGEDVGGDHRRGSAPLGRAAAWERAADRVEERAERHPSRGEQRKGRAPGFLPCVRALIGD